MDKQLLKKIKNKIVYNLFFFEGQYIICLLGFLYFFEHNCMIDDIVYHSSCKQNFNNGRKYCYEENYIW